MTAVEADVIFRRDFQPRVVTSASIRDALLCLGVAPPTDRSVSATLCMFGIAFPNRKAWGANCTRANLSGALQILRLPSSGRKLQLIERISNAVGTPIANPTAPIPTRWGAFATPVIAPT